MCLCSHSHFPDPQGQNHQGSWRLQTIVDWAEHQIYQGFSPRKQDQPQDILPRAIRDTVKIQLIQSCSSGSKAISCHPICIQLCCRYSLHLQLHLVCCHWNGIVGYHCTNVHRWDQVGSHAARHHVHCTFPHKKDLWQPGWQQLQKVP